MDNKILIVDDQPSKVELPEQFSIEAEVSPARHLGMFAMIPYLMLYRNMPRFNFGFGGQNIKTYGSKKVCRIDSADWKAMEHTKIGRNEPCQCGSGKKYKHCCALSG